MIFVAWQKLTISQRNTELEALDAQIKEKDKAARDLEIRDALFQKR